MEQLTIRKPDDFHLHLRQGEPLGEYARASARDFGRALIMPNTIPPISDPAGMAAYKTLIEGEAPGFEALMSFKILPTMSPDVIPEMKKAGALAGKLYPAGATTNAEDGVSHYTDIRDILAAMEETGLVLSIHGEDPEAPVQEREAAYLGELESLIRDFPKLKIVLEHISTKEGLKFISSMPSHIVATVTVQHLLYTIEDLMGGPLNPHLFCKPVIKTEADRRALVEAVCSGHPKLFFGSDSAPHPREKKEGRHGAAGVFTAPCALPLLVEIFEKEGALEKLESFVSEKGALYYGLPLNTESITLKKTPWQLPDLIGGAVPLAAGEVLNWKNVSA